MKVIVPLSPDNLDGPFTTAGEDDLFEIVAQRGGIVLIEFDSSPIDVSWFDEYELLFCESQQEPETIKVIRKATEQERRQYRVPLWIQDDDVPACCERPMFFVGQIDDDNLCTERPEGARLWWHDGASFYVFTCTQCLQCKAVGQQF